MINDLLAWLQRPERGWDPVPLDHAQRYADAEWGLVDEGLVDQLEARVGPLAGRRVLDLGGGPGQYSGALARRGARVTWHDVSRNYLDIARERIGALGLAVEFSLGYLEEAARLPGGFDLVFNRICWYYCRDDREFAAIVYGLVRPGGAGYIDSHHGPGARSRSATFRYELNRRLWLKVGHPHPPPGRIVELLGRFPIESLSTVGSTSENERVLFVRKA